MKNYNDSIDKEISRIYLEINLEDTQRTMMRKKAGKLWRLQKTLKTEIDLQTKNLVKL